LSDTHSHHAIAAVITGTGARKASSGHENQRAAIRGSRKGVQMLTIAMNASTPKRHTRARRRAHSCSAPSVFITSQVAPRSA